ncbi:MAG: DNA-3-methyladenine glycosylase I [Terracidiphilus sp.]|nr:DNA-3-methyladenine glycosylase I [Terracidiphilus sp.]
MTPSLKTRCTWCGNDPLYVAYHDEEWGVPQHDSRALWELLMLEGFQAGLAWITVLRKREAFRAAFRGFDPEKVARFGAKDIERLMGDSGIIRARAKIEATIAGARIFLAMRDEGVDFAEWAWALAGGKPLQNSGPVPAQTPLSATISKELKRRGFKFVGPTIVYAWMQAAGMVNDHAPNCFRRAACAKIKRAR